MTEPDKDRSANAVQSGAIKITFENADASALAGVKQFLPLQREHATEIHIGANPDWPASTLIDATISNLFQLYQGTTWVDATTFSAPTGSSIMLAGQSKAGKTTLGVSMYLMHGWKLISEDVTFIDAAARQVKTLAVPLSLRPDARSLFLADLDVDLELFDDQWFYRPNLFVLRAVTPLPVDVFVIIDQPIEGTEQLALELKSCTYADALRLLLPISNILRIEQGVRQFSELFGETKFCKLSGGSIRERADALSALSGASFPIATKDSTSQSGRQ